jgi:hypothetical protein
VSGVRASRVVAAAGLVYLVGLGILLIASLRIVRSTRCSGSSPVGTLDSDGRPAANRLSPPAMIPGVRRVEAEVVPFRHDGLVLLPSS